MTPRVEKETEGDAPVLVPLETLRPGWKVKQVRFGNKPILLHTDMDSVFGRLSSLEASAFLTDGTRIVVECKPRLGPNEVVELLDHPLTEAYIEWYRGPAEAPPALRKIEQPEPDFGNARKDLTPDYKERSRVGACIACDKLFEVWNMEGGRPMCPVCGRLLEVTTKEHCGTEWLEKLVPAD